MVREERFRQWIEAGYRDYGDDPWFFLRELAQNGRDAGAESLRVTAELDNEGRETLIFVDDGEGMSFNHARNYLFRLYASSKDNERFSAGMYGIGFWTILRFDPQIVVIESRTRAETWAVSMDEKLHIQDVPCRMSKPGTRVTLSRPAKFSCEEDFKETVAERTSHYCRHLRRNDKNATPLPVFFEQTSISRPFRLPGAVTKRFKKGRIEGVVGLGSHPEVRLYARGLPVWKGATLEELSHVLPNRDQEYEVGQGLAPVFLLNGNDLDVNITRKEVMDNPSLQRVQATARQELDDLISIYAARVFPASWLQRLAELPGKLIRSVKNSFWLKVAVLLLVLLPLEIFILSQWIAPGRHFSTGGPVRPNPLLHSRELAYHGASVSPFSSEVEINLTYRPASDTWFKIFSAEKFNREEGFIREEPTPPFSPAPPVHGAGRMIHVRLLLPHGGRILLPQPRGFTIDPTSVALDGVSLPGLRMSRNGEWFIHTGSGGELTYRCQATDPDRAPGLPGSEIERLTRLPSPLEIPPALASILSAVGRGRGYSNTEKLTRTMEMLQDILVYDTSGETARAYGRMDDTAEWLRRVIDIGRGDCDVLNGVLVVLLRRMGIPSRLVVGSVGVNGVLPKYLHAWTEYYIDGWRNVDVSQVVPSTGGSPFPSDLSGSGRVTAGDPRAGGESHTPPSAGSDRSWVEKDGPLSKITSWFYLTVSILVCLLPFLLLRARRRSQVHERKSDTLEMRKDLAQIAIGALLQPKLWGHASSIWHARILPTVDGGLLTMRQALNRGRRQSLLLGDRQNPLAIGFSRAGVSVLNAGDPVFSPLMRLIPGVLDLDPLVEYGLESPLIDPHPQARLLSITNRRLKKMGAGLPHCLVSRGLTGGRPLPIRFPGGGWRWRRIRKLMWPQRPKRDGGPIPRRILAVNPEGPYMKEVAELERSNPLLAGYTLLLLVIENSGFDPSRQARLRQKASLTILGEAT